jgi:sulfur carrier protein
MIYINDKEHPFENAASLADLFRSLEMDIGKGVAVAINNKVIPRGEWVSHCVKPGDKLILIRATQGG